MSLLFAICVLGIGAWGTASPMLQEGDAFRPFRYDGTWRYDGTRQYHEGHP